MPMPINLDWYCRQFLQQNPGKSRMGKRGPLMEPIEPAPKDMVSVASLLNQFLKKEKI